MPEYKFIRISGTPGQVEKELAKLASQGWKTVHFELASHMLGIPTFYFLLAKETQR